MLSKKVISQNPPPEGHRVDRDSLPHEGVGAKKFGMSLKTHAKQPFGGMSRDFCWDILGTPEKFEKKKVVFNCCPQILERASRSTSHIYHHIFVKKYALLWLEVVYTSPMCMAHTPSLYHDIFAELSGVRGCWDIPNWVHAKRQGGQVSERFGYSSCTEQFERFRIFSSDGSSLERVFLFEYYFN